MTLAVPQPGGPAAQKYPGGPLTRRSPNAPLSYIYIPIRGRATERSDRALAWMLTPVRSWVLEKPAGIGVRVSDRWCLGEYEDRHNRWANRWRDDRADQGRRGVGRRGDMGVPYRNDSHAAVPDRLPSLIAGTQRLPTYCKLL